MAADQVVRVALEEVLRLEHHDGGFVPAIQGFALGEVKERGHPGRPRIDGVRERMGLDGKALRDVECGFSGAHGRRPARELDEARGMDGELDPRIGPVPVEDLDGAAWMRIHDDHPGKGGGHRGVVWRGDGEAPVPRRDDTKGLAWWPSPVAVLNGDNHPKIGRRCEVHGQPPLKMVMSTPAKGTGARPPTLWTSDRSSTRRRRPDLVSCRDHRPHEHATEETARCREYARPRAAIRRCTQCCRSRRRSTSR